MTVNRLVAGSFFIQADKGFVDCRRPQERVRCVGLESEERSQG